MRLASAGLVPGRAPAPPPGRARTPRTATALRGPRGDATGLIDGTFSFGVLIRAADGTADRGATASADDIVPWTPPPRRQSLQDRREIAHRHPFAQELAQDTLDIRQSTRVSARAPRPASARLRHLIDELLRLLTAQQMPAGRRGLSPTNASTTPSWVDNGEPGRGALLSRSSCPIQTAGGQGGFPRRMYLRASVRSAG